MLPYVLLSAYLIFRDSGNFVGADARHFVVWLRRIADPEIFRDDIIADYWTTLTPLFYRGLYWPFASVGIDPVKAYFHFVMPLSGILFASMSYSFIYCFWPTPAGAAFSTIILTQMFNWRVGLPHDFGFMLVMLNVFLFFLRRAVISAGAMFVTVGLLPVAGPVSGLSMAFLMFSRRAPFVSRNLTEWATLLAAGIACLVAECMTLLAVGRVGPTFTVNEAKSDPFVKELLGENFLVSELSDIFLCSLHRGIVTVCEKSSGKQLLIWDILTAGVLILSLWLMGSGRVNRWLSASSLPPIDQQLHRVLLSMISAGAILFLVAYATAFRFHVPSRFARYSIALSFGMVIAMAAAALSVSLMRAFCVPGQARRALAGWMAILLISTDIWMSFRFLQQRSFGLIRDEAPSIHAYLRKTPKATMVAGVLDEVANMPAFSSRSVLVAPDLLVPFHKLHYGEMADRLKATAVALYSRDRQVPADFVSRYRIDYILVERKTNREPKILRYWATIFPGIAETARAVESGQQPFFRTRLDHCTRAEDGNLVLADARCIVADDQSGGGPEP